MDENIRSLFLRYGILKAIETYGAAKIKDRHIRYLESTGVIQIGEKDFDRWANSVELEFEAWLPKGRRQFIRWLEEQ